MNPYNLNFSNQIMVVKVIDNSTNQCVPCDPRSFVPAPNDRVITYRSLNGSLLVNERLYICYQIEKDVYIIHNQAVFLELL